MKIFFPTSIYKSGILENKKIKKIAKKTIVAFILFNNIPFWI